MSVGDGAKVVATGGAPGAGTALSAVVSAAVQAITCAPCSNGRAKLLVAAVVRAAAAPGGGGGDPDVEEEVAARLGRIAPVLRERTRAGKAGVEAVITGGRRTLRNHSSHADFGCGAAELPTTAAEAKERVQLGRGGIRRPQGVAATRAAAAKLESNEMMDAKLGDKVDSASPQEEKLLDQHFLAVGLTEKIETVINTAATAVNLADGSHEFEGKQKELRTATEDTCNAAYKPAPLQEEKLLDKHFLAVGLTEKIETDIKAAPTAASITDDSHEIDGKQKELDIQPRTSSINDVLGDKVVLKTSEYDGSAAADSLFSRMADSHCVLKTSEYGWTATRLTMAHENATEGRTDGNVRTSMGMGKDKGKYEGKARGKGARSLVT